MSAADELLQANAAYADAFPHGAVPKAPARRLVVVTCMDARIEPQSALGLEPGDAHVLRNAGGIVTEDVLRSVVVSQHLLGTTAVVVVQHTDCGGQAFTEEGLRQTVAERTGVSPAYELGAFADLEERVRTSLRTLRASAELVATDDIRGFVYDVGTGRLREVVLDEA